MHTAQDKKIMLDEMNAAKKRYYYVLDNFATMRATSEEVEQAKRVYHETCTALHAMLNPNLIPQYDFSDHVSRLIKARARCMNNWQDRLVDAKKNYLWARNSPDNADLTEIAIQRAGELYRNAYRQAEYDGQASQFLRYWRSLQFLRY